jgi:hypothetical protein
LSFCSSFYLFSFQSISFFLKFFSFSNLFFHLLFSFLHFLLFSSLFFFDFIKFLLLFTNHIFSFRNHIFLFTLCLSGSRSRSLLCSMKDGLCGRNDILYPEQYVSYSIDACWS